MQELVYLKTDQILSAFVKLKLLRKQKAFPRLSRVTGPNRSDASQVESYLLCTVVVVVYLKCQSACS